MRLGDANRQTLYPANERSARVAVAVASAVGGQVSLHRAQREGLQTPTARAANSGATVPAKSRDTATATAEISVAGQR
jgi:hypothetical protein